MTGTRACLLLLAVSSLACATASSGPGAALAPRSGQVHENVTTEKNGERVTAIDTNRDGKADVWRWTRTGPDGKERVVRKEKDLDYDGKVDAWELYGDDGQLAQATYDLDFDGKPDATLYFEKGQLVRREYDFGFDGKARAFNYYEQGKLVRKERDVNGDGRIDYWEYWVDGEVDRVGVDLDGDGQVDRWESRKLQASAEK